MAQRRKPASKVGPDAHKSVGWQEPAEDRLQDYRRKRRFGRTPEPSGESPEGGGVVQRLFVIQKHDARRLHYDFRLEVSGVLKSWAVPKGPSTDPKEKRLAVMTEDHPLEYAAFEGSIPPGEYGAGAVVVWDGGLYENLRHDQEGNEIPMEQAIADGHVVVWLNGQKLRGGYALQRTRRGRGGKDEWLLVKVRDSHAGEGDPVAERPESILTGRTIGQIQAQDIARK